jgi:hypothetical protein
VKLEFSGEIWFWRGWHFVTVPDEESGALEAASPLVSYGWGMIPAAAQVGRTSWQTALFPKDGRYLLPVKTSVRAAERLQLGDTVTVRLTVDA